MPVLRDDGIGQKLGRDAGFHKTGLIDNFWRDSG